MKVITANTKISELIKACPEAIDAIASINSHFKKLQNPLLRKLFASRVTIMDAAKIGKCEPEAFFEKLRPLGFIIDENKEPFSPVREVNNMPKDYTLKLDVREDIECGKDPFKKIMNQLSELHDEQTLLLINSFEPVPLIRILEDKNYLIEVNAISPDLIHTYITKPVSSSADLLADIDTNFEEKEKEYENRLHTIDVRMLPMPQPMMTILKELESLPKEMALYVHHKKVPVFLIAELKERNYEIVFKPADDGVKLIIYKK